MDSNLKRCSACSNLKPLTRFNLQSNGPQGRTSACRDCLRERKLNPSVRDATAKYRESYRARNREYMAAYAAGRIAPRRAFLYWLKSVPCLDCGGVFPPCCMDFDHVRGKKLFDVGGKLSLGNEESVWAEIQKCEVVCSNCHRVRTAVRLAV